MSSGIVYLVGAGPGDVGLITWRGVECLRRADLVLYDYLVNPLLLEHCRFGVTAECLGKHGRDRLLDQDEINRRMVDAARAGSCVVRLKSGDPAVFARLSEEIAALDAASIPYEIVPGVTAALAVGSYAGVSLTRRDRSSAVALVTGHEDEAKGASSLDFEGLARFPGTLVFYMGVTTAPAWTANLIAAGKSPRTPAAIVRRCSWWDQRVIHCPLQDVPQVIAQEHLRPPVVVIVGEVVGESRSETWFTRRPLLGTRVLVTRPATADDELSRELTELGAEVLLQPAIEIAPPHDPGPLDKALGELHHYHWLVFSSANGVRAFLDRLLCLGDDLRSLGPLKIAAVGPGTAAALKRYYLSAEIVPEEHRAEGLIEALVREEPLFPLSPVTRCLLIRASRGREVLAAGLTAAGYEVDQVVAYESRDVITAEPGILSLLAAGKIDFVTVTSSAIARSLVRLFGDALKQTRLVSISPLTSAALREMGQTVSAEATQATLPAVAAAIAEAR